MARSRSIIAYIKFPWITSYLLGAGCPTVATVKSKDYSLRDDEWVRRLAHKHQGPSLNSQSPSEKKKKKVSMVFPT